MPRWKTRLFWERSWACGHQDRPNADVNCQNKTSYSYLSGNKHLVPSLPFDGFGLLAVVVMIFIMIGSALMLMSKACKSGYHSWCAPMSALVQHHTKTRPPA
jgi:hypothetical protein